MHRQNLMALESIRIVGRLSIYLVISQQVLNKALLVKVHH